jgi:hypothetical protein
MMFPPRDPTRRRFLAVAAVASVVSACTLAAAAAMDPSVPAAVAVPRHSRPDPVFGLIEANRKADRDHEAALDEQERLERIGDHAAADLAGEATCHAAFDAFDLLLAASLPGIRAKLAYRQDIAKRESWMFNDRPGCAILLIESFAASIANISVRS